MNKLHKFPVGILALAVFFIFGSAVSVLTCAALLFPGGILEPMWRLKPEAHEQFLRMGLWGVALMVAVGLACALSAYGLLVFARWGYWLALSLIGLNLVSDLADAVLRADFRTLIGLPIGGAMIAYLLSAPVKRRFIQDSS